MKQQNKNNYIVLIILIGLGILFFKNYYEQNLKMTIYGECPTSLSDCNSYREDIESSGDNVVYTPCTLITTAMSKCYDYWLQKRDEIEIRYRVMSTQPGCYVDSTPGYITLSDMINQWVFIYRNTNDPEDIISDSLMKCVQGYWSFPGYPACVEDSDCNTGEICNNDMTCILGCTSHSQSACYNDDVYWYDSCGTREGLKQDCLFPSETCLNQGSNAVCLGADQILTFSIIGTGNESGVASLQEWIAYIHKTEAVGTVIWDATQQLHSTTAGGSYDTGGNVRLVIQKEYITTNANSVRLKIDNLVGTYGKLYIGGLSICERSGGDQCVFGTLKRVTKGGANSWIVNAYESQFSDWITINIDETKDYLVSYYTSQTSAIDYWVYTGTQSYVCSATPDQSQSDAGSGCAAKSYFTVVNKIEGR